jgi:hypothetical protein
VRANCHQKADGLIAAIFKDLDKWCTTAFDDQTVFVMNVL